NPNQWIGVEEHQIRSLTWRNGTEFIQLTEQLSRITRGSAQGLIGTQPCCHQFCQLFVKRHSRHNKGRRSVSTGNDLCPMLQQIQYNGASRLLSPSEL